MSLSGVVKGHQAKHSSTTSMSIEVGTGLCRDLLRRPKELGGYGYGFLAGAYLFPMPIVLTGGGCLAFQSEIPPLE